MNLTEHDIDWIVAEVVRRLEQKPSGGRASPEATLIPDRVITLETLQKYNGSTELIISPQAILTPAARDELTQRNVRLVRRGTSTSQDTDNRPATSGKLLAASIGADYQSKTLAQLVSAHGAALQLHAASALQQVIETHCPRLARETAQAVWFTSQPAHAVCLANRHADVWAVQGTDEASVQAAVASMPANVLVIDPRGKSQYALRKMIESFIA